MSNKCPSSRIKMNYVEEKFIRRLLSAKMWKTTRGFSTMLLRYLFLHFLFFHAFFYFHSLLEIEINLNLFSLPKIIIK